MKKHVLIVFIFFTSTAAFSQCPINKGQGQLNAGVGFSSWGIPLYFGFDYGVHKDITIGAELSYRSYNDNWADKKYRHSVFGISGNGNYHFNSLLQIPSNWDFYAGLNIGFYIWNSSNDYYGSHSSGLGLGLQVGGRYYFTDKLGINLEFGGGNAFSGGKIGISLKM